VRDGETGIHHPRQRLSPRGLGGLASFGLRRRPILVNRQIHLTRASNLSMCHLRPEGSGRAVCATVGSNCWVVGGRGKEMEGAVPGWLAEAGKVVLSTPHWRPSAALPSPAAVNHFNTAALPASRFSTRGRLDWPSPCRADSRCRAGCPEWVGWVGDLS